MRDISKYTNKGADEAGVQRFVVAMNRKMRAAREEKGWGGWHRPRSNYSRGDWPETFGCSPSDLRRMLKAHIRKKGPKGGLKGGNLVDIANFCMMIWNREHPRGPK